MADPIRTILVGTPLDESSDAVVALAGELARGAGARVHLAHGYEPPLGFAAAPELGHGLGGDAFIESERERLRSLLAAQAGRIGAEWSLEDGAAHHTLPALAEKLDASLVIVGAAGTGARRRLGSTADRVIRKAARPVLVVRGEPRTPFSRVLAPVDLSPLSAEAFGRGLGLLAAVGGDAPFPLVEALFVLDVIQRQVAPQFTPEQVDRFAAEELDRFVAAHAGERAAGIRRKVRCGGPREEILAEALEWGAGLVLLGTHGLGGFDRMVIGSVAADAVRESPVSVLVVPPAERPQS
ncbi:MAG: universal stress protein [Thermoanaerobaculia bacterium]